MTPMVFVATWGERPEHWSDGGAWWPIFPIAWFLLVVGVVVTLASLYARRSRPSPATTAAEARLAERFASGDIDEQEYQERLTVLRRSARSRKGGQ